MHVCDQEGERKKERGWSQLGPKGVSPISLALDEIVQGDGSIWRCGHVGSTPYWGKIWIMSSDIPLE